MGRIKVVRNNAGRLWMVYPKIEYMPCFGVFRIIGLPNRFSKMIIKSVSSEAKLLLSFLPGPITFEGHYGDCQDPRDFNEYNEFFRIKKCFLNRQWISRPVASRPDEERYLQSWFEFTGELDYCPWLYVKGN